MVFLFKMSLIIYALLFFIGAVTGAGTLSQFWEEIWHTPGWKREAIQQERLAIRRNRTPAQNLEHACGDGLRFAGNFVIVPVILLIGVVAKHEQNKMKQRINKQRKKKSTASPPPASSHGAGD